MTGLFGRRAWCCLHRYKDPIFPYLYRPMLQIIPLATGIAPVLQVEFVTVNRANNIAQGIYITFSHNAAGMRTSIRKRIQLAVMLANADFFVTDFY